MIAYSVTKDNPEGIDRFQLFTTKEMAEAVAKLWVEKDEEENREMEEEAKAHHSQEENDLRHEYRYEWRRIEEDSMWGYGRVESHDGKFHSIYTIFVHEVEIHETLPSA